MIKQLFIKNYILIDELILEFDKGLNVITGETGAGKSILINAIDFIFGNKANKDIIKTGTEKASLELTLENNHDLSEIFDKNGLDNIGNELIISKDITKSGSRTRINGTLVNQDIIRELREIFLDIHSQNQTYSYLQPKHHITLLDNYAKELYGEKLYDYKQSFEEYQTTLKLLKTAKSSANATESQIEFLKFQINEIQAAQINDINEENDLRNELVILENAEKLKDLTQSSYQILNGEDASVLAGLFQIKSNISKASTYDENILATEETLIDVIEQLKDVSSEIRDYSQGLEFNEGKLNEIQERLYLFDKLKRKYGNSLEEILNALDKFEAELNSIEFSTQNIEELELKSEKLLKELNVKATAISEKRKDYAEVLSNLIVDELEKLELPKVRFKIAVEPCELNENGLDKVEFLISTNVSEDLKPLAKVASGGEVSRVMLAIKSIFAQSDDIDTVIFDEIDTGISGKASQSVAEEIESLANYRQIILITHQAIIASKAQKHFYVSKKQEDTTSISISVLEKEEKIRALAELAGGDITQKSIDFAKSLLSN